MAILLPIGIRSKKDRPASDVIGHISWLTGGLLFVNPDRIELKRSAIIGEVKTMGGTAFQPWTNAPDEIRMSGIMYGTRSVVDMETLSRGIDSNPVYKDIVLIYKWKEYPGFIRNVSITAMAAEPGRFNYSFDFVGRNAIELYRMMIGNLTNMQVERNFLKGQVEGTISALGRSEAIASMALAVQGAGKIPWGALASRLVLFMSGASFLLGRGRGRPSGGSRLR